MTLVGEFRVSAEMFALQDTLYAVPDGIIEIERVVASGDVLTPYFWVSNCDLDAFEKAVGEDPSVRRLRRLDVFEEAALYRADWTERTEAIAFAYTTIDAVIVEATGRYDEWELRIRFDDRERLQDFRDYCHDEGIAFTLERLYDESADRQGARFGLTEKQADALMTTWKLGYFESPRKVTLQEVAEELGIAKQSLAQRLRRAHQTWIENALAVTPPEDGSTDRT
jgi:predicted DNA binding protein